MGILNSLKQKPDNQKKVISLILALVLTFFIVGFWFSFTNDSSSPTSEESAKLSSMSPWQVIKDEFSKAFSGFNSQAIDEGTSTIPIEVVNDEASSTSTSTGEITATSTASSTTN